MKRRLLQSGIIGVLLATSLYGSTGMEILRKVDSVSNAPRSKKVEFVMTLYKEEKMESKRSGIVYEEGSNKRLMKFTSPASLKGIAFLSLPGDIMYVYLPSFRKVRRIATSVKNTTFAGTDFTYDELSTFEYTKKYTAQIIDSTDSVWVLKLLPKNRGYYAFLKMWVNRANYIPLKIEFYDRKGELKKVLEYNDIQRVKDYVIARKLKITDLKKHHSTEMDIKSIELDVKIPESVFTKRYLRRG